MSLFAPSYYPTFRCIAGDCRHSCCIGWEIDIDPKTLSKYRTLPPKERKQILAHTVTEKGTTFFRLAAEDRCPFLTKAGLCQLILTHGEGILCDICREHPRFYNHFSDRTEVGVGLCCEEAARLILTNQSPFELIELQTTAENGSQMPFPDPFEEDFFQARTELFAILTNRAQSLQERINAIVLRYELDADSIYRNDAHWQTIYRNLERLDPAWDDALNAWETSSNAPAWQNEIAREQLIAYFLYRHLSDAIEEDDFEARISFALLSAHVISTIATARGGDSLATLIDTARAYSAEVEYNEEAVSFLLSKLGRID